MKRRLFSMILLVALACALLLPAAAVRELAGTQLSAATEGTNQPPTVQALELRTYKNVAVNGQFAAADPEGDLLRFMLVKKPARGEVSISEEGSGAFVYTPFENKTGKDSFTYVAVDSLGNISQAATVKVTISKAKTKAVYGDMTGHPAHKAAIRLAEEGIFVGECMDGVYYFQPEQTVSREQFVALAMSAAGQRALSGVTVTGFADDEAIPTWAKGYLSSALMCGVVKGVVREDGAVCFNTGSPITKAEATVVVNRLLRTADSQADESFSADAVPVWAYQSAVNLSALSVLSDTTAMTDQLSRGDAAQILCAMLEYRDSQKTGWFPFG